MKTIAIFNNKGGVAKTTTVINVAYTLSNTMEKKILIIDCDGQQNASRFFSDNISRLGIEHSIITSAASPVHSLSHTRYKNIDILTSTSDMNECASFFNELRAEEKNYNMTKIKNYLKYSDYDYVFLDMPPTLNCITEQLLSISDGVIVPVELGTFAIQGIAKVTETINKVNASFIGCFISKFDVHNRADNELKQLLSSTLGNKIFDTVIPYSNIIRNSINYRLTAFEYMHWLSPTKKYIDLTKEIIRKVG
ncbi:MAG: ParA family protein [Oscillospiraceae bacterium]|nr:ParA family protein [Oscillospiraceae bacterium]